MPYHGHVENGVVVLDDAAKLPDGAQVQVDLVPDQADAVQAELGPTLYERLESVIGKASGLPADAASNVEHYLYGQPKR